jgi:hypothetical protein
MAVTNWCTRLRDRKKINGALHKSRKGKPDQKIIIYSNRRLPAISLYEKFGFAEVPLDDCIYERADIKMEKLILQ